MNPSDKRKFPRITFKSANDELEELTRVNVTWPGGAKSRVLDMSYGGAALSRPQGLDVGPRARVELDFQFEGKGHTKIASEIIRVGGDVIAVHFLQLAADARLTIESFLKEKLLGLSLKLVNPHYYGAKEDFTYWFHGPNDTNVFLWMNKKARDVHKAMAELAGQVLFYEAGQFSEGESSTEEEGDKAANMTRTNVQGMSSLMQNVLELVTQVQEGHELLEPLISVLMKRSK